MIVVTAAMMSLALRGWMPGIRVAARAEHVDATTLAAIVFAESTGRAHTIVREHDGSCSVGLGGVNVPSCEPGAVAALLDPTTNLHHAAVRLAASVRWCAEHPRDEVCAAGAAAVMYGRARGVRQAKAHMRAAMRQCAARPQDAACAAAGGIARYNPGDSRYPTRIRKLRALAASLPPRVRPKKTKVPTR